MAHHIYIKYESVIGFNPGTQGYSAGKPYRCGLTLVFMMVEDKARNTRGSQATFLGRQPLWFSVGIICRRCKRRLYLAGPVAMFAVDRLREYRSPQGHRCQSAAGRRRNTSSYPFFLLNQTDALGKAFNCSYARSVDFIELKWELPPLPNSVARAHVLRCTHTPEQ